MKWRAELRDRELERMSMLEREWRRREATRTAEVAQIKAHYAKLDSQTRQVSSTRKSSTDYAKVSGSMGWDASGLSKTSTQPCLTVQNAQHHAQRAYKVSSLGRSGTYYGSPAAMSIAAVVKITAAVMLSSA